MNGSNAIIFSLIGSAMEALPIAFPSWFLPMGADHSSARALWLDTMGAAQIGLGLGYLVRAHLFPAAVRLLSAIRERDSGQFALADPRAVPGR
ncbi:MAG TPA: hypothetical protein VKG78_12830 [Opitutaceae bacterium]|nr:hypothetical protein [Opitutaceae bacterium]